MLISIITFANAKRLIPQTHVFDVCIESIGKLRAFRAFLEQFNLTKDKVYSAVLHDGEESFFAFSDYAAFLYKRKGQIVRQSSGNVQLNSIVYKVLHPFNIKIYSSEDMDCKLTRVQAKVAKCR